MSELDGGQEHDDGTGPGADQTQRRISEAEDRHEDFVPLGEPPRWLRPLLGYQRVVDRISERAGSISKYLVVLVVALGFVNAVLRYVGRFSGTRLTSNRYLELQWYLYAILFLVAFGYILKNGINVRVDFWYAEQSQRRQAWIDLIGHLIALIPFCVLALWVVWGPVLTSFGRGPRGFTTWRVWEVWEQSPDPGGLPRAPIKMFLVIGFGILLLQALAELVKLVAELTGHGRHVRSSTAPLRIE